MINMQYYIIKSMLDWVAAFVALLILWPVFLVVAIAIKINSPGPAFFVQPRLGKHGKVFKVIKFRSMVVQKKPGNKGNQLKDECIPEVSCSS